VTGAAAPKGDTAAGAAVGDGGTAAQAASSKALAVTASLRSSADLTAGIAELI
jgi:hypothetical protein